MSVQRIFTVLALLTCSCLCWGATVSVSAGDYTFYPPHVTINVGDTVTWSNFGGLHNVLADDNSFGNGAPSATRWTYSHTFTTAGTFGYYCTIHGTPGGGGMAGMITVGATTPPPPSIALGGYLSGNWYNPSQGGHGFQLEFTGQPDSTIPTDNEMGAIWFVYTPNGPIAGDATSGQNWIYAQGPYDATTNTVTLSALLLSGPKFPSPLSNFNSNDIQRTSWGTVTFTFSDCNNGTMSWNSTMTGYGTGTMPIQRLTSIQGTSCPASAP